MKSEGQTAVSRRRIQLLLWWMLYRLPVDDCRTVADLETAAAAHCRLSLADLGRARQERLEWFANAHRKRQRRLAWQIEHGSVPDGWTPPEAGKKAYRRPVEALFHRAYSAPMRRKADASQWSERKTEWASQCHDDYSRWPIGHWRRQKGFERLAKLTGFHPDIDRIEKAVECILPE